MRTLTIKNLPPTLYLQLRQRAQANRRTLNNEVIDCIEKALIGRRADPEQILAKIAVLRAEDAHTPLDEEFLRHAKNEGRP